MSERDPQSVADDEALAIRMMDEDETALVDVLKLYGRNVKAYLLKQFGQQLDDSERNYVFQTALIKLWKKIGQYDPRKGSLRGWWIRIAYCSAIDHIRRGEKYLEKSNAGDFGDPADSHNDECHEVSLPIDSREQKRLDRIHEFIHATLVGIEREVALNYFAIGGDPDRTRLAQKLGRSCSNIDTVKSKVKRKIRESVLSLEKSEDERRNKQ